MDDKTGTTRLHEVSPSDAHTGNTLSAIHFVQRALNRDYRIETGKYSDSIYPPELDGVSVPSKIPPMMTFDNPFGHFIDVPVTNAKGEIVRNINGIPRINTVTRVFEIRYHETAESFYKYIGSMCKKSINRSSKVESDRYCWDIQGTVEIELNDIISSRVSCSSAYKKYAKTQKVNRYAPLSVHTIQAWHESINKRGKNHSMFKMVSVSTTMTSIAGGINNNLTIEMGFDEQDGIKDLEKRAFDTRHINTICIGSTPHNEDAGKVRRLNSYSRARMLSPRPLWPIEDIIDKLDDDDKWVVHCMGSVFQTSEKSARMIIEALQQGLKKYYTSQFGYPDNYYIPAPPTFMVYHKSKVIDISIAPGVVLKGASQTGDMGDSSMILDQKKGSIIPPLQHKMSSDVEDTHNPYYLYFTYPKENQQPRPAFANSQTVQCQGLPWGPANAIISPNYVSNPLIGTKFGRMVEQDHMNNMDAIWDVLPGQNLVVCFMALPENYEDGIVISQKFADMGGFSNMSIVPIRLREREEIPEVGERICGKKYKWWKVPCTETCVCYTGKRKDNLISVKREPTGIVKSIELTKDGSTSVHVLSFSQINDGDKLGNYHGQKGVQGILPYEDLPMIITQEGHSIVADIYISPASIICRQTHGMAYESGASLRAARDGRKGFDAIFDLNDIETEESKMVLNPYTGRAITRINRETKKVEITKASFGIIYMIAQTQTSREKHHLTHDVEGKYSMNVIPGRGSGGGVSRSEMDAHVSYANGTTKGIEEIVLRENTISDFKCGKCNRIMELCECGTDEYWKRTILSSGLKEFDVLSACINESSNIYET